MGNTKPDYVIKDSLNFSIINFLTLDGKKVTIPVDGVYISQFLHSDQTCSLYGTLLSTPPSFEY